MTLPAPINDDTPLRLEDAVAVLAPGLPVTVSMLRTALTGRPA